MKALTCRLQYRLKDNCILHIWCLWLTPGRLLKIPSNEFVPWPCRDRVVTVPCAVVFHSHTKSALSHICACAGTHITTFAARCIWYNTAARAGNQALLRILRWKKSKIVTLAVANPVCLCCGVSSRQANSHPVSPIWCRIGDQSLFTLLPLKVFYKQRYKPHVRHWVIYVQRHHPVGSVGSEPIKKRVDPSHPIKLFQYGTVT